MGIFAEPPYITLPCVLTSETAQLAQSSRWTYAAVALGNKGAKAKRFFAFISFYNVSVRDQGRIRTNRGRLLHKVFSHASGLGEQPVLLCMDANTSMQASRAMSLAVASGRWYDLGSYFTDGAPAPTFGPRKNWDKLSWTSNVSRPGYIFANPSS